MVDLNDEWTGRKQDGSGRSFVRPSIPFVRSYVGPTESGLLGMSAKLGQHRPGRRQQQQQYQEKSKGERTPTAPAGGRDRWGLRSTRQRRTSVRGSSLWTER